MSETSGPTPAQLEAANLVAVNTWEEIDASIINEQGPLRTYDPVHKNFPPVTFGYVTAPKPPVVVTSYTVTYEDTQGQNYPSLSLAAGATFLLPVAPTNAPNGQVFSSWGDGQHTYLPGQTYTMPAENVVFSAIFVPSTVTPVTPSGITIPSPDAGFTRMAFDDFLTTSLSSMWSGAYNGESGGTLSGLFINKHLVLKGDSLLRLEAYPDPTNIVNCFDYTAALAASVNNWGGAGVQSTEAFSPPVTFWWVTKFDVYPGIAPMGILFGRNSWPPEQDIMEFRNEISSTTKGQKVTELTSSFHYGSNNSQEQISFKGTDFSQWHLWKAVWTETGTTIYCDGVDLGTCSFTTAMLSGSDNLSGPEGLCFQVQTGDADNPAADPSVTASTPITLYVDSVAIDVPA